MFVQRNLERRNTVDVLATHTQRFTARCQDCCAWGDSKQAFTNASRAFDEMLAIVEDKQ